ncbi:unnamed protein product [Nyctereutes procyonoides]|uniref:(raccoon dog) hypothetical protein n=1 Tax=Nyctereutes procyonoides TaxID=34880 RepID=A0A811ZSD8_NYCPR|nr:unnamed protein product [Nyctereutes procyonoides]
MKKLPQWRGPCGKELRSHQPPRELGNRSSPQLNLCYKFVGNLGANTSLYFSWAEVLPFLATVDLHWELPDSQKGGRGHISPQKETATHSFGRSPMDCLPCPNLLQQCWENRRACSVPVETSILWAPSTSPCWRHSAALVPLASCYLASLILFSVEPPSVATKQASVMGICTLSLYLTLEVWGSGDTLNTLKLLAPGPECTDMVQASLTLLSLTPKLRGHSHT